jgi:hypothetical protein
MTAEVKWLSDDVEFKGKPSEFIGEARHGGNQSWVVKVTHVKIDGRWAKLSPQLETEVHGL